MVCTTFNSKLKRSNIYLLCLNLKNPLSLLIFKFSLISGFYKISVFGKTLNATPKVKPQVTDSLMKLLDSFLLTITCRGQIVLVSPSVEQHLGHCQVQNILSETLNKFAQK